MGCHHPLQEIPERRVHPHPFFQSQTGELGFLKPVSGNSQKGNNNVRKKLEQFGGQLFFFSSVYDHLAIQDWC